MNIESIRSALSDRFSAPLPEFHKRRVVFWFDPEKDFGDVPDELKLDGVKILRMTGSNNFGVKKLLEHDDTGSNYLVYCPVAYADIKDDWLTGIELYSEEFRADLASMIMSQTGIEPTVKMRKVVNEYARFFDNKDRRQKLHAIGRFYDNPAQLQIDIMTVLADIPGGTCADLIQALLCAGMDRQTNTVLDSIRRFGCPDKFSQLVMKLTGFAFDDGAALTDLRDHILLSALANTAGSGIVRGLERYVSESGKLFCFGLVHEWQRSSGADELYELCRAAQAELRLPERFDRTDIDVLLRSDIFPAADESILRRLFDSVTDNTADTQLILRVCGERRTCAWQDHYKYQYSCLYYLAKMEEFCAAHAGGWHITEGDKLFDLYTSELYVMDTYYRQFYLSFSRAIKDAGGSGDLEDHIKQAAACAEALYKNRFLNELNSVWINDIKDDLAAMGYAASVERQRDFYYQHVCPVNEKEPRAFVIISDALRYETAAQLREMIEHMLKGKAAISAMQSVFPSVTKFGMAALLPGKSLTLDDDMNVYVDGAPSITTEQRGRILNAAGHSSTAIQYRELAAMKKDERRALVNGMDIVYIYHNKIDAIGDKAATEPDVFEACDDALDEIVNIVRIITGDLSASNIIITADHGFLYTYEPLDESEKLDRKAFDGSVNELARRYALVSPGTTARYLLPVELRDLYGGTAVEGFAPRETVRMKIQGGGENYVHGGISLQEMAVPVITFRAMRSGNKKLVESENAGLRLLSQNKKITNLIFSLDFYQIRPVGDKVLPCTYNVWFCDEDGGVISDRHTVIADRTDDNASQRAFRLRFNLRSMNYDRNKKYRLIIANDTDMPDETEFTIDILFADDFGFLES